MGLPFKEDTANNYYIYLIEGGDDANDGSTPALAIETMARGVYLLENAVTTKRRTLVIVKHKIVDQSIASVSRTSTKPITFLCLNRTIFDGSGTAVITLCVSLDKVINAIITGYNSTYFFYLNATYPFFELERVNVIDNSYTNGVVSHNASLNSNYITLILKKSVVKNSVLLYSFRNCNLSANQSVIISSTMTKSTGNLGDNQLYNCYLYNCSTVPSRDNIIDYCNIQGTVQGLTNAQLVASGQNINGISADPLFNDSTNNVYTVASNSPCLYAGTNNQHIGIGEALYLDGETLMTAGTGFDSENITLVGTKITRTDVNLSAFVETIIFHNGTNRIVNLIELSAALGFVADALVQSVQLEDDSTIDPYVPFLTFKIKVASSEAGIATADWIVLPFNQQPLLDEAGVGNGDNTFDTSDTLQYLKLNYFKLFIGIQNLA